MNLIYVLLGLGFSISYLLSLIKVINEGNEALVERLGQFDRKLEPGLNYVIPFIEKIVVEETIREKVLNIDPQNAITKDNVSLQVDAVIYWQIVDLESTFYNVENIKQAIENLVLTALRSSIGSLPLEETYSSRKDINQKLLNELDEATGSWGVKILRVEVRDIKPVPTVMESLEQERAAESKKRAALLEAQGTVEAISMISDVLKDKPNAESVLQFLVARRYVEANEKLGGSTNSKVVFMDPKAINEAMAELIKIPPKSDSGSN